MSYNCDHPDCSKTFKADKAVFCDCGQLCYCSTDCKKSNTNHKDLCKKIQSCNSILKLSTSATGTGATPNRGQLCHVHYEGTLINGEEFDSSRKKGRLFKFNVHGQQVIRGWDEAVSGMKIGERSIFLIHPNYAYGSEGVGPIPGNAFLIFDIELCKITNGKK